MPTGEHPRLSPKDQYHREEDRVPDRGPAGQVARETQEANVEEEGRMQELKDGLTGLRQTSGRMSHWLLGWSGRGLQDSPAEQVEVWVGQGAGTSCQATEVWLLIRCPQEQSSFSTPPASHSSATHLVIQATSGVTLVSSLVPLLQLTPFRLAGSVCPILRHPQPTPFPCPAFILAEDSVVASL